MAREEHARSVDLVIACDGFDYFIRVIDRQPAIAAEPSSAIHASQYVAATVSLAFNQRRVEQATEIVSLIAMRAVQHYYKRSWASFIITLRNVDSIRHELAVRSDVSALKLSPLFCKRIPAFCESRERS